MPLRLMCPSVRSEPMLQTYGRSSAGEGGKKQEEEKAHLRCDLKADAISSTH
jgi:hypothetical protein